MSLAFIIGSHRTGTKLLGNFFSQNITSANSIHQYNTLRFNNIVSNMYLAGLIPEFALKLYLNLFWFPVLKKATRNKNVKIYIESNGFNFYVVNLAKKKFKEVKVVHIIRDPRDYVKSYANWINSRKKSRIVNTMIPFWHVTAYMIGEMKRKEWKKLSELEKYCWYWAYKNNRIEKWYSNDDYLRIKFEDIIDVEKREAALRNLLSFLGLDYKKDYFEYFNKKQNASMSGKIKNWRDWDNKTCKAFYEVGHELMNKYDYGLEKAWEKKIT